MKKTETKQLLSDNLMCIGCHECEIVCSVSHFSEVNPRRARIRIDEDTRRGTAKIVHCRQCVKPTCVAACPTSALTHDTVNGKVNIDYNQCNGCLECVKGCPFDAIFIDVQTKLPLVCDLCGGNPLCVNFCHRHPAQPYAALYFTTHDEFQAIKKNNSTRRG